MVGTGGEAGADEDDFHILGRKKHEVDHEEKREKRAKRVEDVKVGALTGTVRPLGNAPAIKARKVVTF